MIQRYFIRLSLAISLAMGLCLVPVNRALAQDGPDDENPQDESGIVLVELGQSARLSTRSGGYQTMGAGGHLSFYIPPCTTPPHGAAYAVFQVARGPYSVDFHGNRVWGPQTGFCNAGACTIMAWAGMPFTNDLIWGYSVTASQSFDISHWCSGSA